MRVGRDKLLRIAEDAEGFVLEDYAALEGPNRYFKNKLGGLGQYYFGPLRDLRVLDHHEGAGYPGYDEQRGRQLAEAFASAVPEDSFFRVLEQQTTTWEELDELAAFCPCKLHENAAEPLHAVDQLGDFGRDAVAHRGEAGQWPQNVVSEHLPNVFAGHPLHHLAQHEAARQCVVGQAAPGWPYRPRR